MAQSNTQAKGFTMAGRASKSPKTLTRKDIGYPEFKVGRVPEKFSVFDLSSHTRAREALEFALDINGHGFNAFVLGEDRAGRLTETLTFLEKVVAERPAPDDWVYLNNFRRPNEPAPYRLPAGDAIKLSKDMERLVQKVRDALSKAFASDEYKAQIKSHGDEINQEVNGMFQALRREAEAYGLNLVSLPDGSLTVAPVKATPIGETTALAASPTVDAAQAKIRHHLNERLVEVSMVAGEKQAQFEAWVSELDRSIGDAAIAGLVQVVAKAYKNIDGLGNWFVAMHEDILDNLILFRAEQAEGEMPIGGASQRYAVNVIADHSESQHPQIVLESNPSYENLFGRIEYRRFQGGLFTDFTLIRPGALHRANGGILVLRAEDLAMNPLTWAFLKGALRDEVVRIEELGREGSVAVAGSPKPRPIPLEFNVVLIGAPQAYYAFFSVDPEYRTHFKVKADIDPDMAANAANRRIYAGLIRRMAEDATSGGIEDDAIECLLGYACRLSEDRRRLTARYELLDDVLREAVALEGRHRADTISRNCLVGALESRVHRNARIEDRMHEAISDGTVMITTKGKAVGQINALVVRDLGDHAFGAPVRVTARASVGHLGAINIERQVALGGPIQQKGMLVLQGFLAGTFARTMPISFDCSVTFEQSYGGVEGDSASLAELISILSALAGVPLRQDLAITGSVNQHGRAQAIGGVTYKAEGFHRACRDAGKLTGTQGVVLPAINARNLVLESDVAEAVEAGQFHLYPIDTVEQAVELLTGVEAGKCDRKGQFPPDSVFGRAMTTLTEFDAIITHRKRATGDRD
jgi:predicted ATP-dependent protease